MRKVYLVTLAIVAISCNSNTESNQNQEEIPIVGTWELLTGTIIELGDTTVTNFKGTNVRFIKVINNTHFTFLNHDVNNGADSTATFVAGGGSYELNGNTYTEHLEYCNFREWEGHDFEFTVEIRGDTLIQQGIEEIADLGVKRHNKEVYIRTLK